MGSSQYNGGAAYYHSLSDNLAVLKKEFPYANGYFGKKGQGRSFTRNIVSEDPAGAATKFYLKASYGGIERTLSDGKGKIASLKDGTIITYRKVSSSDGSPVIEINISNSSETAGVKTQKIHFVQMR